MAGLLVACARQEDVGTIDSTDTGRSATTNSSSYSRNEIKAPPQTPPTTATPTQTPAVQPAPDVGTSTTRDSGAAQSSTPATQPTQPEASATATPATDDATLKQSVQTALSADSEVGKNITVTIDKGVVTLSGTVSSNEEKQNMEAKAKAVAGVSRVENKIEVKSGGQTPP